MTYRNRFPYAVHASVQHNRRAGAILIGRANVVANLEKLPAPPSILVQTVIVAGDRTKEGQLIEAVAFPWFDIIDIILKDPEQIYKIHWRTWEEIIAGAYKRLQFDVTLTPRSNDGGRDVIAELPGVGCIKIIDQVKAYAPGRLVTADDVRVMLGVLTVDTNVSKGVITTTSDFAPGILKDDGIKGFMPYRLELKPKDVLLPWLASVAGKPGSTGGEQLAT
jgi:restriction system protein